MALAACVLWLAGFEIMPWLHVALHDGLAPHIHTADGTIVQVPSNEHGSTHQHADGTVHREPRVLHVTRAHHRPTGPSYALDHGAGSLAHHGVAVSPAAPPLHAPLPVDIRATVVAFASTIAPIAPSVPLASARGPPAASSLGV
jgi:hypothetical protein